MLRVLLESDCYLIDLLQNNMLVPPNFAMDSLGSLVYLIPWFVCTYIHVTMERNDAFLSNF